MTPLWRQALLLCLLAAIPAVASAVWFGGRLDPPPAPGNGNTPGELAEGEVTLDTALGWGDTVLWIDARPDKVYAAGHIPGAVSLNLDDWDAGFDRLVGVWDPGAQTRLVVYCDSRACDASREVADRLRGELGHEGIYVLEGGWQTWQSHNP